MVCRRLEELTSNPPPCYEPGSRLVTVALVVKHNCELDDVGNDVIKWDNVPLDQIRTKAHLDHFTKLAQLKGTRQFFIQRNMGWDLVTCDTQVLEWAELQSWVNEVTFTVKLEGNELVENHISEIEIHSDLQDVNLWVSDSEDGEYSPHNDEDIVSDDASYMVNVDVREQTIEHDICSDRVETNIDDNVGGVESESEQSDNNFALDSDDDIDSALESDFEDKEIPMNRPKKKYVKRSEFYDPQLQVGIRFPNKTEFRKICTNHAIAHMRNIKFDRNDRHYIYAKCDVETCSWFMHAQLVDSEKTWSIYKCEIEHNCGPCYNVHNLKSGWLAERYLGKFKVDPDKSVEAFRDDVLQDLGIKISKDQAYRAKRKAVDMINGDPDSQFELIWDYGEELKRSNPGTTVLVDYDKETKKFTHFYVCFGGLKQSFMHGCRPIIGVDGAHLKGPHGSILLTACAVDPNDKPLPLAWAVVTTESGATWTWFLEVLKKDLHLNKPEDYTFMSDKQKGLLFAFKEVFPESVHRFCVMHLWKNMYKAGFRGDAYRTALFKASNATTIAKFNTAMKEMGEIDDKVLAWLHDKHPTQWAKSHFHTLPKCDATMNNGCENYNKVILPARQKPIITMMEWLREYNMGTMTKKRDKCKNWKGEWCPVVKKTIDKHILRLKECIAQKSDDYHFQITQRNGDQYTVDLIRRECICRRYDLTGMPCLHVVSALSLKNEDPYNYVHKCYSLDTYKKCFQGAIMGINGQELWGHTFFIPPLPPNFGRKGKKGKPEKARRLGFHETKSKKKKGKPGPQKMKRQQNTLTCSYCGIQGHNMLTCRVRLQDLEDEAQLLAAEEAFVDDERYRNMAEMTIPDNIIAQSSQSSSQVTRPNIVNMTGPEIHTSEVRTQTTEPKKKKTLGLKRYTNPAKLVTGPTMAQQIGQCAMPPPLPNTVLSQRLNIRAPPPFVGNQFLHDMPPDLISSQESSASVPSFMVGGKKYITLSNLTPALQEMNQNKTKGKKKKKDT